jgi:flagellar basal-body rod protein FlgG
MMRSLWTAASGMRSQQVNVDTISNNIANVNTIGYKTEQASFKSLLYQNLQSTSTNNALEEKPVAAEVGLGSRVAAITSQFTQGELLDSTDPYTVAIEGDGFFEVQNANGEVLYTRDGAFNLSPVDGGNMICNSDGYPVLDVNGNSIIIPDEYPLQEIQISQDGVISFPDGTSNPDPLTINGQTVQLAVVQFNNPAGLEKLGGNNYGETVASGAPIAELRNENLEHSKVQQYYREGSNVDVANEMVNLIIAPRAYELNSKAIQTSDTMMQEANNLRS